LVLVLLGACLPRFILAALHPSQAHAGSVTLRCA
jgi:hypothetical protein